MRRVIQIRPIVKFAVQGFSVVLALPLALVAGFGRFSAAFQIGAHIMALVPGIAGDFLRTAYYFLTLRKCSLNSRVSFGSFFAQRETYVGQGVYIGAYSIIGACEIGERTQIASHVQVLSGKQQHGRTADGKLLGAQPEGLQAILIGSDCWIGASAVVMADVGPGTTIGAAAVVTRPVPAGVVAVGNPARLLESSL
jgi:virginiamycin A acetyltransferase